MLIVKYVVSALLIVGISEIAKSSQKIGAFIGALPLVTLIIILWIFLETNDTQKVADYSKYTFWYVLPTLPAFIIFPALVNKGINFWLSLLIMILITVILFYLVSLIAKMFDVFLL